MKTSELIGPALDWAVAKCEGQPEETLDPLTWKCTAYPSDCYNYSTNWSQGGQIIEREGLEIAKRGTEWRAMLERAYNTEFGPTPLIAAMRCYVVSKLGDEIEIPEGLQ